jgi:hypothetical protein
VEGPGAHIALSPRPLKKTHLRFRIENDSAGEKKLESGWYIKSIAF